MPFGPVALWQTEAGADKSLNQPENASAKQAAGGLRMIVHDQVNKSTDGRQHCDYTTCKAGDCIPELPPSFVGCGLYDKLGKPRIYLVVVLELFGTGKKGGFRGH